MPSRHAAAEELVSNRCRLATVGELMRGLPARIQAPWLQGPPGAAATKPETDPEAWSVEIKISISKKKQGLTVVPSFGSGTRSGWDLRAVALQRPEGNKGGMPNVPSSPASCAPLLRGGQLRTQRCAAWEPECKTSFTDATSSASQTLPPNLAAPRPTTPPYSPPSAASASAASLAAASAARRSSSSFSLSAFHSSSILSRRSICSSL